MDWSETHKVEMSLSIHGGALVVNYPLDGPTSNIYSGSKHDEYFKYISKQYVENNRNFNSPFKDGVTNGAQWYSLFGGMQDWQYIYKNSFEITLELSNEKLVNESDLQKYWNDNINSFINSIKLLHIGLKGIVTDTELDSSIKKLTLINNNLNNSSDTEISSNGFFCIPLKPGNYILRYRDLTQGIIIKNNYTYRVTIDYTYKIFNIRATKIPGTPRTPSIPTTPSIPATPVAHQRKKKKKFLCALL